MKWNISAVSDKGCVRQNNEDMILVGEKFIRDSNFKIVIDLDNLNPPFLMVAVADGMGGMEAGEIASQLTLQMFKDNITNDLQLGLDHNSLQDYIDALCKKIHNHILQISDTDPSRKGMGSTLAGLMYYQGTVMLLNVGDSRIYRLRNNILKQMSNDHSLRELTRNDDVPVHIITNSIGGGKATYAEIDFAKRIFDKDIYLICSDGLSDMLCDDEIERILLAENPHDHLLKSSMNRGGHDNISYIIVEVMI